MGDEQTPVPSLLHADAAWKNIQQNTFTRWVNNHLKKADDHVDNLATDFSDGLRLIKLVEVLSHKKLGRYNKKVSLRSQKLENVSLALSFLQNQERIRIVSIDSSHIVDGNRKLILGLVWTLILHYSISISMPNEEPGERQQEVAPTQRLLTWIRTKLPTEVPVSNFTTDWNDGRALAALTDSLAPGYLPDWRDWKHENALDNTTKAMDVAQNELSVAQLITPEELVDPNVDEKSVMTYIAQFPQAPPAKPKVLKLELVSFEDTKLQVGTPATFTLLTHGAPGRLEAKVLTPAGEIELMEVLLAEDGESYALGFVPKEAGDHFIYVSFDDETMPDSPFAARVHEQDDDRDASTPPQVSPHRQREIPSFIALPTPTKGGRKQEMSSPAKRLLSWVNAKLPEDVQVSNFTTDWNDGRALAALIDSLAPGSDLSDWRVWKRENALDNTTKAMDVAERQLGVAKLISPDELTSPQLNEKALTQYVAQFRGATPLRVSNKDKGAASKPSTPAASPRTARDSSHLLRAWGRGLAKEGVVEGEKVEVNVDYDASYEQKQVLPKLKDMSIVVRVTDGSGREIPVFPLSASTPHRLAFEYVPAVAGEYAIEVLTGSNPPQQQHVYNSPYKVFVADSCKSRVRASGHGLKWGIENLMSSFNIDANGEYGPLGFAVEGPARTEIRCEDKGDGLTVVTYTPSKPGIYNVSITADSGHIKGSPFCVPVDSEEDYLRSPKAHQASRKAAAAAAAASSPTADSSASMTDSQADNVRSGEGESKKGTEEQQQKPNGEKLEREREEETVEHISYERITEETRDSAQKMKKKKQSRLSDGSQYTMRSPAVAAGSLGEGGAHMVRASGPGLERGETLTLQSFNVNTKHAGGGTVAVAIEGPSEAKLAFLDHKDGNCQVDYIVDEPGDYAVSVKFDEKPIPHSPFEVSIVPHVGEAAKLELATSEHATAAFGEPFSFTVFAHGARGQLEAKVLTPPGNMEAMDITRSDDGEIYELRFAPTESGTYFIYVTVDGVLMRDSPFRWVVADRRACCHTAQTDGHSDTCRGDKDKAPEYGGDANQVRAAGAGLRAYLPGADASFTINAANAGPNVLMIGVMTANGPCEEVVIKHRGRGQYSCTYRIQDGDCGFIYIKYGDRDVPGSPFPISSEAKEQLR